MEFTPNKHYPESQSDLTVGEYTYMFLPKNQLIHDPIHGTEQLLKEAVNYDKCISCQVSTRVWEHLINRYNINQNSIIIDNVEVPLDNTPSNGGQHLLMWLDLENPASVKLYFEIFANNCPRQGLNKFLDPNYGGRITEEYQQIARVIVWG